jgi:hypothetical protein
MLKMDLGEKCGLARACDKSERMDLADGLANLVVSRRRLAAA